MGQTLIKQAAMMDKPKWIISSNMYGIYNFLFVVKKHEASYLT